MKRRLSWTQIGPQGHLRKRPALRPNGLRFLAIQTRTALAANLLNTSIIILLLVRTVPFFLLFTWLGGMVGALLLRAFSTRFSHKQQVDAGTQTPWLRGVWYCSCEADRQSARWTGRGREPAWTRQYVFLHSATRPFQAKLRSVFSCTSEKPT